LVRPQLADEDLVAESHRQDAAAGALLLGRQTFEDFRGYWPKQDRDPTGITAYLNRVAKYVVSSTMTDPEWENSTVLTGDPIEQTKKLKIPETDVGRTAQGVHIGYHAAALARRVTANQMPIAYSGGTMRRGQRTSERRRRTLG
jgi:dihydrofolate reductase